MPFKSEKQRRYLWANEPEIARDWTDTYGSKIKKAEGGISQLVKPSGDGKRPGYYGVGCVLPSGKSIIIGCISAYLLLVDSLRKKTPIFAYL